VAQFDVLFRHLPRETEGNNENTESVVPAKWNDNIKMDHNDMIFKKDVRCMVLVQDPVSGVGSLLLESAVVGCHATSRSQLMASIVWSFNGH
jgi:hypothetical protein